MPNLSLTLLSPQSHGSEAEAEASDILQWTDWKALVATEKRSPPMTAPNGRVVEPSQCSSAYIFPGIGLGVQISSCTKLRDEQFIAAAEAVARCVTGEDLAVGAILPSLLRIREVSAHVAQAVALKAYQGGYATALPKPHALLEKAKNEMYSPYYRTYR